MERCAPGQPVPSFAETQLNTELCEAHEQSPRELVCGILENSSPPNPRENLQPLSINTSVSLPSTYLENEEEKLSQLPIADGVKASEQIPAV